MTWKWRLAVIGLFAVLICLGVGLAMILTPDHRPGVTKANFDKLEVGMSKEQVESWLVTDRSTLLSARGLRSGIGRSVWVGEDGAMADICYSVQYLAHRNECKVVSITWTDSTEMLCQRIRRWIGFPV